VSPDRDYSGTPLARKLGIRAGAELALLDAPDGFLGALAPLPDPVAVRRQVSEGQDPVDVLVLFVTSRSQLGRRFEAARRALAADGGLWVAWPKKASGRPTDLDFTTVQAVGLEAGLVDNKSCAIDEVWTALRFVVRLADRPGRRGGRSPDPDSFPTTGA
jgi:hypothetical protein